MTIELEKKISSILFIDDDDDDVSIFRTALSTISKNIHFQNAYDGSEALDLLTHHNTLLPDLIFLDLNMPKVDGFQCLEEIKNNDTLKDIPVIIFTTSSSGKDKAEAARLGAKGFITKPNTYRELCEILSRILIT